MGNKPPPSITVKNDTKTVVNVALKQGACTYFWKNKLLPGESKMFETGAVWFTIEVRSVSYTFSEAFAKTGLSIAGPVIVIAATVASIAAAPVAGTAAAGTAAAGTAAAGTAAAGTAAAGTAATGSAAGTAAAAGGTVGIVAAGLGKLTTDTIKLILIWISNANEVVDYILKIKDLILSLFHIPPGSIAKECLETVAENIVEQLKQNLKENEEREREKNIFDLWKTLFTNTLESIKRDIDVIIKEFENENLQKLEEMYKHINDPESKSNIIKEVLSKIMKSVLGISNNLMEKIFLSIAVNITRLFLFIFSQMFIRNIEVTLTSFSKICGIFSSVFKHVIIDPLIILMSKLLLYFGLEVGLLKPEQYSLFISEAKYAVYNNIFEDIQSFRRTFGLGVLGYELGCYAGYGGTYIIKEDPHMELERENNTILETVIDKIEELHEKKNILKQILYDTKEEMLLLWGFYDVPVLICTCGEKPLLFISICTCCEQLNIQKLQ